MSDGGFAEPERKLAAIMAADVVGFSRMMGVDEAGTLARLDRARREVIDPAIAAGRGRIFKVMGDGLLVEFGSVVQAVRAALAIQAALAAAAKGNEAGGIVLRIGLHQGDVVVQGSDLLGDGVNVAARLERLAPPGGVCMSARVREDAAGKIALTVEDGGERSLRNIAQPVRVFIVRPGAAEVPGTPLLAAKARILLAVPPFAGRGGARAEALAAELGAALLPALSHWPGLLAAPVPAAGGAEALTAARAVGAAFLVQGIVREDGAALQMAVRVLDARTGEAVWGGRQEDGGTAALRRAWPDQVAAAIGARLLPAAGGAAAARVDEPEAEELPAGEVSGGALAPGTHRVLVVASTPDGPREGHVVPLPPALVIGRQLPSDLVLPGGEVSRAHCRVELAGDLVTVVDLRSTNGTFVDGERIAGPARIAPGATLKLGPYLLRYLRHAPGAEPDPEATLVARP